MNKNLKIAIYTGETPSTTFIERLINGLAKKGMHIYIFGLQRKEMDAKANTFFITYTSKISKLFLFIKYSVLLSVYKNKAKKKLDKIILSKGNNIMHLKAKYYPVLYYKPDIFHLQWAKSISEWIWVQEFGMELILSLRGTHITISPNADKKWKQVYQEFFPRVKTFHAVSTSMLAKTTAFGVSSKNIHVIKSGLPLKKFPFTLKTKVNTQIKILSIGRSHFTKGYRYALDAMQILKTSNSSFQYSIIGLKQNEALLYQRAQLGLMQQVSFIAPKQFREVQKAILEADVLLLPSIEEGIANVVLEAMALGTLVISTNCGGMQEVILPNKTGFLVPTRNPEAIANAVQEVQTLTLKQYQEITKQARSFVEENHSEEKLITGMSNLYNHVIAK
ncbi:MAG: glycosyltransferase family 4 protein [Oceanihabitans sp.]